MISVRHLRYSYDGRTEVLKGIHLDIDSRSTAIIGQNGAGKTTFVKILKGLLKPTQGVAAVMGKDTAKTTAAQLAGTIGLVFQNPNDQIFKKSVREEVLFGPLNIKMPPAEAEERAYQALEEVGLRDKTEINPHDLNLSEKKLLCVASILAMNTPIVILDEPTIAQDWRGKEKIRQIIRRLKDEGKLVMTIIHDMDFAAECFERTVVLNDGGIVADGDAAEVFADEAALRAAHVEPPHLARLGAELGMRRGCLTEEAFIRTYKANEPL